MPKKTILFIITESVLYLLFLILDLQGVSSTWIKYAGILLAVCFSFWCASRPEDYLTALALFFTAAADYFLLVLKPALRNRRADLLPGTVPVLSAPFPCQAVPVPKEKSVCGSPFLFWSSFCWPDWARQTF